MQAVKMFTTAVCPYCTRAKQLLKARGVEQIEEIRIDQDPSARTHMMESTGRRTVPQIFIGSTHVGGYDDLAALDAQGGLVPLLNSCRIPDDCIDKNRYPLFMARSVLRELIESLPSTRSL